MGNRAGGAELLVWPPGACLALNISRDGTSTNSLGSQDPTTLTGKNFYLISHLNLLSV